MDNKGAKMQYTVSIRDHWGTWARVGEYTAESEEDAKRMCLESCARDYAENPSMYVHPDELGEMLVETEAEESDGERLDWEREDSIAAAWLGIK